MTVLFVLGLILLAAVIYWLLDRHEKRRAAAGQPRHSGLRLIFGSLALLTILFSGGCGLLFLANMDGLYVTWQAVAMIAGPPLAVGLLVWWLAMRRPRAGPVKTPTSQLDRDER